MMFRRRRGAIYGAGRARSSFNILRPPGGIEEAPAHRFFAARKESKFDCAVGSLKKFFGPPGFQAWRSPIAF